MIFYNIGLRSLPCEHKRSKIVVDCQYNITLEPFNRN